MCHYSQANPVCFYIQVPKYLKFHLSAARAAIHLSQHTYVELACPSDLNKPATPLPELSLTVFSGPLTHSPPRLPRMLLEAPDGPRGRIPGHPEFICSAVWPSIFALRHFLPTAWDPAAVQRLALPGPSVRHPRRWFS